MIQGKNVVKIETKIIYVFSHRINLHLNVLSSYLVFFFKLKKNMYIFTYKATSE